MEYFQPSCITCANRTFKKDFPTCKAFPDGIPNKIWEAKVTHEKHFPGDKGILYEKIEIPNMQ